MNVDVYTACPRKLGTLQLIHLYVTQYPKYNRILELCQREIDDPIVRFRVSQTKFKIIEMLY